MRYLEGLEESSKKKVEKARKLERQARAGTTPKGRAYKAVYDAASSISRGRVKGVAKAVSSLINQRRSELSEAKKRFYTQDEIKAYARGREKATIARRKKEFEDFYSKPKKKKAELEEAKVDKGKPYGEKTRARAKRDFDRAYQHVSDTGEGKVGKMIRSKDFRKTAVEAARARRKAGEGDRPLAKLAMKEAYTMLGDVLAEAISKAVMSSPSTRKKRLDRRMDVVSGRLRKVTGGDDYKYSRSAQKLTGDSEEMRTSKRRDEGLSEGLRSKVADKLDKFSRKQYSQGEVDDASGKPKRASLRGRVAHVAGKAAQKIRPGDES